MRKACVAPVRTPVKITGAAPGKMTLLKIVNLLAPIERELFIKNGSIFRTPTMVVNNTGHTVDQKIIASLATSPIPKNKIKIGNKEKALI
ncbi:hypothetical protein SDC9_205966 [bioreactor metagenome]|uniref:Uncharacterized protein n=1 Tax=bioreactor metagenome TaxID=1076179 RepID=A0A645JF79_9ZZZZ